MKKRNLGRNFLFFAILLVTAVMPLSPVLAQNVGIVVNADIKDAVSQNIYYGNAGPTNPPLGSLMLLQRLGIDKFRVDQNGKVYSASSFCDINGANCIAPGGSMPAVGAAGSTLYSDGTSWAVSQNIYNNNGNVGIGTATPGKKFDVNGDFRVNGDITIGGTGKKIIAVNSVTLTLPAQGTKVAFLNIAQNSLCKVVMSSSENSYFQPTELYVSRKLTTIPLITRDGVKIHEHSYDVSFSADSNGDVWMEKVLYSTGRNINITSVEQLKGTCSVLSGSTTATGNGSDQSIIAHNVFGVNGTSIYYNTGNVGIGTASPDSKVEVYGTGATQLKVTGGSSSAVETVVLSENAYGWIGTQTNHPLYIGANYNGKMYIGTNGNIGIGTTGPNAKLDVRGATKIVAQGSGWEDQLNLYSNDGSNRWNILVDNGASNLFRIAYNGGSAQGLNINTSGSVGIGTASICSTCTKVQVEAGSSADAITAVGRLYGIQASSIESSGAGVQGYASNGGKGVEATSDTGYDFYGKGPKSYFAGNVGVGTNNPDSKIEIYNSGPTQLKVTGGTSSAVETVVLSELTYGWIGTITNHPLYIGTANGGKMYIKTDGSVGIGTDNPVAKLHVSSSGNTTIKVGPNTPWSSNSTIQFGDGDFCTIGEESSDDRMAFWGKEFVFMKSYPYYSGYVGIGVSSPSYQLQLGSDSAGKPNGGSWSNTSDQRLKTDIGQINGKEALEKLSQLNGMTYHWINPEEHAGETGVRASVMAQNLKEVFPQWVTEIDASGKDKDLVDANGKAYSIGFPADFNAYLIEAIKELKARVEVLEANQCK
ncbi:MAG: tail fiber domain-containing protein [Patescibacteria group bacterium]|jgi:hypothetical protein